MLHLKHAHHFHLPHFTVSRTPVLSPVLSEHDELIEDIEKSSGEAWELADTPDVQGLDTFWNGVQDDLRHDPQWFSFAED